MESKDQVAAVIVEPVGANMGVVPQGRLFAGSAGFVRQARGTADFR